MNVVIWNEVGIRATPSDKGKYVTSIYLGERFDLVGDTASEVGDTKRIYFHKIQLSDGTTGWVRDEFVALHVSPAAIMNNAVVCKRPDEASVTDKTFSTGDFVVVRKVNGRFLEVTGKLENDTWYTTGYISKEFVSYKPIEAEYAALSRRAYDKLTTQKVKDVLLARLQDASVFGQSLLWDHDFNNVEEGDIDFDGEEEPEPVESDTTNTENN